MSKMIKCKTCGADIASSAKVCPSCGAKNKKPIYTKWWFWVIVVIVVAGAFGGGGSNKNTTQVNGAQANDTSSKNETKDEEVITISAVDLVKAFDENEINANKLYKGKLVEITGVVYDIGESFGQTYITLESGEDVILTKAQCYFKDQDQIDKVAELSKGDTVTLVGRVDGKSLNVSVEDCTFR